MFMNFDDRGRLYIAESTGKDLSGKEMAAAPECQILRLEDTDGDGVFDTRTIFARELSLPMGLLWHQGSLFVASPPDFLRFDDTDNDGTADRRTVLLTGWNILNTASLHGPFLGPDGLLYLTHGRHGYKIATIEGPVLEGLAARIWRCRPDGTGLERFAGGGFDNPVELVFTDTGQMLGTMTYFTDPRYGQRDALMHWVWGGVYPKPHEATGEMVQTGPLMPVMSKFARIAPAGFMRYEGTAFGPGYRGNLFSAQFNPHRVQFHRLMDAGSTYSTQDEDFLTSTSPDFYPTDVLEDGDGSLLVCDTGAWYVDACPISRVAKPEITGAIYRITKTGAASIADVWGRAIDWSSADPAELVHLLGGDRRRVRERAFQEVIGRGDAALPALRRAAADAKDENTRRQAVWAVFQIAGAPNAAVIRAALDDASPAVRTAAMQALAELRDRGAVKKIATHLSSTLPLERREAATALGRIGDAGATAALLEACGRASDRFEEHALTYALIELGQREELLQAVTRPSAAGKAALIALDQLHAESLKAEHVVPFLQADSAEARQAGLWVASHHPEWSATVLAFVDEMLRRSAPGRDSAALAKEILVAYSGAEPGQLFIAERVNDGHYSAAARLLLLDAMDGSPVTKTPPAWRAALGACLHSPDAAIRWRALEIVRSRGIDDLSVQVTALADNPDEDVRLRMAALGAVAAKIGTLADGRLSLILGNLSVNADAGTRQAAATVLGKAKLDLETKRVLAKEHLPTADVLVLTTVLHAFAGESDPDLGVALLDGLAANPHAANLITQSQLDNVLKSFPAEVQARAAPLKAKLDQRDAGLMKRFLNLEPRLGAGDVGRGRALFFGEKAACSTCHAVGSEGGALGPDLTTIGLVRSGHDLLEAILFPSASMVPDYQPYLVDLRKEVLNGIVKSESPESVTLKTAAAETRTLQRSDILSMVPASVSMMPEGLDAALSDEQLLDLIAFLRSLNNEQWLLPEKRE
jgi:putative membrane-bound dehydrogenase-like protein